jgi:hypothetical protein
MRQSSTVKAWMPTWSALVVLLLLSTARIFGATITVTSTADSGPGSLPAAIASAANGDTINFSLTYPATIVVSTPLTLGPSVTIAGPGASNLAISGGDSVAVLIVNAGATVAISGVTIEHGSSLLGGGIFNDGTLTLTDCLISNNTVGNQLGGGIFNAGTLTLTTSTVSGNAAVVSGEIGEGGGIYNYLGTVTLINSAVSGNTAGTQSGDGGGIFNSLGTLSLTNSTVSANTASAVGGIDIEGGTLSVVDSTVSNNVDYGLAGGIHIFSGSNETAIVNITNSTISGNSCGSVDQPSCNGGAGGIFVLGKINGSGLGIINMTLSNSTLSGNSCTGEFGLGVGCDNLMASLTLGSSLVLKNTILANNGLGPNCSNVGGGLPPTSEGYNLSDDATCASFLTQTGDLNNTPAGLDPGGLKNNGGPTQTVALLATSAAVNAIPLSPTNYCTDASGNPVTTDQRGVPRPQGSGCDIGAFELAQVTASYTGTFNGNLNISSGVTFITNGTVTGNVSQNGGSLVTSNATIRGNLQITGGGTFSIASATINGDLQIQNIPAGLAQNQICGTDVEGNLTFHNNGTAVVIGNSSGSCAGNTIENDLQIQNNTAPVQVVGNAVGGNLQCQNNSSITGGTDTAKQTQGQCAGF